MRMNVCQRMKKHVECTIDRIPCYIRTCTILTNNNQIQIMMVCERRAMVIGNESTGGKEERKT